MGVLKFKVKQIDTPRITKLLNNNRTSWLFLVPWCLSGKKALYDKLTFLICHCFFGKGFALLVKTN